MDVLPAAVAIGVVFVYLFLYAKSYWEGNEGLNDELFD